MKKRLLGLVLTLCMALTLLPTMAAASANPFTDVASGTYYHDAVLWAKDSGITGGTTATTFSPAATCTRGQVVTFLWRAEGQPEPASAANPFTDVKSGDYYYKPVLWAVEKGITGGTSTTTFSPAATCTAGQVVTFLWRANGSPEAYAADGAPYYAKAVSWAAEKGLLDNMGSFSAAAPSPRSAIVTYLYRNAGSPAVTTNEVPPPQVGKLDGELYRVLGDEKTIGSLTGVPYRAEKDGDLIGVIPHWTIVEVLSYDKNGYAKVKYSGGEVYVWAAKLKKLDKPDAVCSTWAQERLCAIDGGYVGLKGAWFGTKYDYTRAITRKEMADMLVWIMEDIYGTWAVQFTLPIVTGDAGEYYDLSAKIGFRPGRLVYWGVAPLSFFQNNLDKPATYGEMTDLLVKLMDYNHTVVGVGTKQSNPFTKAVVSGFTAEIGGKTDASASITYEQARILKEMTNVWYEGNTLKDGLAYQKADQAEKRYEGLNSVGTGKYTIQTYLGGEGKHPYLTINAQGKGELQSGKPQSFQLTYLETDDKGHAYTIQTMDGKYLGLEKIVKNGHVLQTQDTPYRWYISGGRGDFITSGEHKHQKLNASGWNTKDGTPVISWFCNGGIGTDNDNYKFYFEYAK